MNPPTGIAENLLVLEERTARAAEKAGRRREEIVLVAVSKTQPVERIREALAAGVREIGENYVQEAEGKLGGLGACASGRVGEWESGRTSAPFRAHLIGHLQRNKAGKAAALFDVVQTVDSVELARALGRRAAALGRTLEVLIEANVSREPSKHGVELERVTALAAEVAEIEGLRLRGLMGIGPLTDDERAIRRSFQELFRLFSGFPAAHRQVLSMGMSGDFELAIAEGSTMVRIGAGIFGARRSEA